MSYEIIDRRLNPSGKNLGNRQRFLARQRAAVRRAVADIAVSGKIRDIGNGETAVPVTGGTREPAFRIKPGTGERDHVLNGNKEYRKGDRIARPQGGGSGGNDGAATGDGEDPFRFFLTREEFLEIFFEDLELPEMVKKRLREQIEFSQPRRAGYATTGTPSQMAISRTMRNRLGRDLILRKPLKRELEELEQRLAEAEADGSPEVPAIRARIEALRRTLASRPFIDPMDLRFRRFEPQQRPISQAVMFCLMDVSGSMDEHMKDLAKRFFLLLYVFLTKKYKHVDIVFIRHTHEASEVDENTFFYSRQSGGTIVSTALIEMLRIMRERYDPSVWNVYAAEASDGDNLNGDEKEVVSIMTDAILPAVQHFAYLEVREAVAEEARDTSLWKTYEGLAGPDAPLAMQRVHQRNEIFPVFRAFFEPKRKGAAA
ncbi:MAG TPA: YeaH/YhbH family protein [Candidatus Paceibacterota bacterium]|nr:YeaH/YhbH family protein [Candidatus Paceibacterota bacterium]